MLIDDFSFPYGHPGIFLYAPGTAQFQHGPDATMLGAYRRVVLRDFGQAVDSYALGAVGDGTLTLSTESGTDPARLDVIWDGGSEASGDVADYTGLGGVNLIADGATAFRLTVYADEGFDPPASFSIRNVDVSITVWDMDGQAHVAGVDASDFATPGMLGGYPAMSADIPFAGYSLAGVDLANVGAIVLSIVPSAVFVGPGWFAAISYIDCPAPESGGGVEIVCSAAAAPATPASIVLVSPFRAWLRAAARRIVLAEVECWDGAAAQTHYLSKGGYVSGPGDAPANICYLDALMAVPVITMAHDAPFSIGDLVVANPNGERDAWLGYAWDGRPVRLFIGDPGWPRAAFRPFFTGIIANLSAAAPDSLTFKIRDKAELLNAPLQPLLIASGPQKGQPHPLAFGDCHNVSPAMLDSGLQQYEAMRGTTQAIRQVRSNGAAPVAVLPGFELDTFFLANDTQGGEITLDIVGGGYDSAFGAPGTRSVNVQAAWLADLAWYVTGIGGRAVTAVYSDGAAIPFTQDSAHLAAGQIVLSPSVLPVSATVVVGTATAGQAGTSLNSDTFQWPVGTTAIGQVYLGGVAQAATVDNAARTARLAFPLAQTVYFEIYDPSGFLTPDTQLRAATWYGYADKYYYVTLDNIYQQVTRVLVGTDELTAGYTKGPGSLLAMIRLTNLAGATVTADTVQGIKGDYVLAHSSGNTWTLPASTTAIVTADDGSSGIRLGERSAKFVANISAGTVAVNLSAAVITADVPLYKVSTAHLVAALAVQSGKIASGDIDAASFTAHHALQPAPVGLFVDSRTNAIEAINQATAGAGSFWHFDRLGRMRIWRLGAPTGSAVAEFGPDDIRPFGVQMASAELPWSKVKVQARPNYTKQSKSTLQVDATEDARTRYADDFLADPGQASNTIPARLGALTPDALPSLFAEHADAQDEAERIAGIRAVDRRVYEINGYLSFLGLEQGDEIKVRWPRFGFQDGAYCIVLGAVEDVDNDKVTLRVWL